MAPRPASVTKNEMDNAAQVATARGVTVTFETQSGMRVVITPGGIAATGSNPMDKILKIDR